MTTPAVVRDAVLKDRLFGYDVKSISFEGQKYYIASSIFKPHFNRVHSERFKQEYGYRFPGLRETVVTYHKLHQYCAHSMTQDRLKNKTRLMTLIAEHEEPCFEIPAKPVGPVVDIPIAETVEAKDIVASVKALGPARALKILQEAVPELAEFLRPRAEDKPRTIKITMTIEL